MKTKSINTLGVIYLILVNTQYYWEQNLGFFAMISMLLLYATFIMLSIMCLFQAYKLIRGKFEDKNRLISLLLITSILTVTYFKPYGIVNFEKFEDETVLEASRTGGGNCNENLKLFENNTFKEYERCFSTSKTKGNWNLINDTIYFTNIKKGVATNEYYKSAIIVKSMRDNSLSTLIRFKNKKDTIGRKIWITKNELLK